MCTSEDYAVAFRCSTVDRKRFDLDMESMAHDCHLIQMFFGRLADRTVNNYHARLGRASEREVKIHNAADTIVNTRVKFFDGESSTAHFLKQFEAYEKEVMTVTQQKDLTSVHVVPFLNCISPSLVVEKAQILQLQLSGLILNTGNRDSVGVALMPQCSHAGQLYKQENLMMGKLHKNNVLADTKFAIPLEARKDVPDNRPLIMDGRLITGVAGLTTKSVWNNVRLPRNQMTMPTPQFAQSQMVSIENLDDDSNPLSMDASVQGAAKWSQLSVEANHGIIAALLDGLPPCHKVVIVLDLVSGPGGFATAMVDIMATHSDAYFAKFGQNVPDTAFSQQTIMQRICEKVKSGGMHVPTIAIPSHEPPEQVMQQSPVRIWPCLNGRTPQMLALSSHPISTTRGRITNSLLRSSAR